MSRPPVALAAVVPAAGRSERMGRDKLLLPWGESVVVGAVVEALRGGGVERVAVVAAADNDRLVRWARSRDVILAINPRPERGMLSSILEGIEALGGVEDLVAGRCGLLICPGDHPALRDETVRAVAAALGEGVAVAVPVVSGRRGHPLGIAPRLLGDILRLDPGVGLRELLELHPAHEVVVDDPGALLDVDRPADYERALAERPPDPSP